MVINVQQEARGIEWLKNIFSHQLVQRQIKIDIETKKCIKFVIFCKKCNHYRQIDTWQAQVSSEHMLIIVRNELKIVPRNYIKRARLKQDHKSNRCDNILLWLNDHSLTCSHTSNLEKLSHLKKRIYYRVKKFI